MSEPTTMPEPSSPAEPSPPADERARSDKWLARRESIVDTSAKVFAKQGYHATGIVELCDANGLGKGAFYHYIGSKEELLYSIMTEYMMQLNASANHILERVADTRERIVALSESFTETMFHSRAAMTVCYREVHSLGIETRDSVLQLHSDYQRVWERTLAEGAERGECRVVSRLETKALLGMYFYSFLWVKTNGPATSKDIARDFANIVLAAVSTGKE